MLLGYRAASLLVALMLMISSAAAGEGANEGAGAAGEAGAVVAPVVSDAPVGPDLPDASGSSDTPVVSDAPAAPVVSDAPDSSDTPISSDPPIVSDAPVSSDTPIAPAVSDAPADLSLQEAAASVDALFAALPADIRLCAALDAQRAQVLAARAAYEAADDRARALVTGLDALLAAESQVAKALDKRALIESCCRIEDDPLLTQSTQAAGTRLTLAPRWVSDSVDVDAQDLSEFPILLRITSGADLAALEGRELAIAESAPGGAVIAVTAYCEALPALTLPYRLDVKVAFPAEGAKLSFAFTGGDYLFHLYDLKAATAPVYAQALAETDIRPYCLSGGMDYALPCKLLSAEWVTDADDETMPSYARLEVVEDGSALRVSIDISDKTLFTPGRYTCRLRVRTDSADARLASFVTDMPVSLCVYRDAAFDFAVSTPAINRLGEWSADLGAVDEGVERFVITRENNVVKQERDQLWEIVTEPGDGGASATLRARAGRALSNGKTTLKVQALWKNGATSVTQLTVTVYEPKPKMTLSRASVTLDNAPGAEVAGLYARLGGNKYQLKSGGRVLFAATNADIQSVRVADGGYSAKSYPYQACFAAQGEAGGGFSIRLASPIPADAKGRVPASVRMLLYARLSGLDADLPVTLTVRLPQRAVKLQKSSATLYLALEAGAHAQSVALTATPESFAPVLERVAYQKAGDEGAVTVTQDGASLRFALSATAQRKAYRLSLYFAGVSKPAIFTVNAVTTANAARLGKTTLALSKSAPGEAASCSLTLSALNQTAPDAFALTVREVGAGGALAPFDKLDLSWDGKTLTARPNERTEAGARYKLEIAFADCQHVAKRLRLSVNVGKESALKLSAGVKGALDVTNRDSLASVRLTLTGAANKLWYRDPSVTAASFALEELSAPDVLEIVGFDGATGTLLVGFSHWNSAQMARNGRKALKIRVTARFGGQTLTTGTISVALTQRAVKQTFAMAELSASTPKKAAYGRVELTDAAGGDIEVRTLRQTSRQTAYTVTSLGNGWFRIQYKNGAVAKAADKVSLRVTPKGGANEVSATLTVYNAE